MNGRSNPPSDAPASEAARLDQLCMDTLRTLSINAVQQAHWGHPGTPMDARGNRHGVLPPEVAARVSVEAASPLGWERHVGQHGTILGMRSVGISAPCKIAQAHLGFEVAHVVAAARQQIARHAKAWTQDGE